MTAQEYLKAIRDRGLTQAQIADKTGIPQGTISKIERGQVGDVLSKTYLAMKALHDQLESEAAAAAASEWDGVTERRGGNRARPTPAPTSL